jgi:hypothetical protein
MAKGNNGEDKNSNKHKRNSLVEEILFISQNCISMSGSDSFYSKPNKEEWLRLLSLLSFAIGLSKLILPFGGLAWPFSFSSSPLLFWLTNPAMVGIGLGCIVVFHPASPSSSRVLGAIAIICSVLPTLVLGVLFGPH